MSNVVLSREQYFALISLARTGATTSDRARDLEAFLEAVDRANNITRYVLLVQWQEQDTPLPPATRFPQTWPPELRAQIERHDRPIARADVTRLLASRARNPTNVLVTRDVGGIVGWTKVEEFFIT